MKPTQTMFDIALIETGTIESIFDIALLNNIGIDHDLGEIFVDNTNAIDELVRDYYKTNNCTPATRFSSNQSSTTVNYSAHFLDVESRRDLVRSNQTLFDFALIFSGGIESVFEIAFNNGLNPGEILELGQKINDPGIIVNQDFQSYYYKNGLRPATGDMLQENITSEGIGFMGIEVDFIIK